MPTRADMEAAVPRCPRHGVARNGQLHPSERCLLPLRREAAKDDVGRAVFTDWRCSRHGRVHGAELQPAPMTGVAV